MKHFPKGRKPKQDYSLLDWSRKTSDLAKELNMTEGNVSRLRRKHAKETINQNKNKDKVKYNIDWAKVDWSKKTKQISLDFSIPYETVNQARRRYAPETIKKREFLNLNKLG
jgi:hypothetical protein